MSVLAVRDRSWAQPLEGLSALRPTSQKNATTARHVFSQVTAVLGAALTYFSIRHFTEGSTATATVHALQVQHLERLLHLDVERSLQSLVVDHRDVTRVLNWIYIFGHWPVIITTLLILITTHRDIYRRVRNALLISGGVGLVIFATFPVSPPRLAESGLVDTVTLQSKAYRVLQPPGFTDQYAAMPSLHVGWNLLMSLAIFAATRRFWIRVAALTLTVGMEATVLLTGNHYLLDSIAGAALATASWYLAGCLQGRRRREPLRVVPLAGGPAIRPGIGRAPEPSPYPAPKAQGMPIRPPASIAAGSGAIPVSRRSA